jgi:hypothetical protein
MHALYKIIWCAILVSAIEFDRQGMYMFLNNVRIKHPGLILLFSGRFIHPELISPPPPPNILIYTIIIINPRYMIKGKSTFG